MRGALAYSDLTCFGSSFSSRQTSNSHYSSSVDNLSRIWCYPIFLLHLLELLDEDFDSGGCLFL